MYARRTIMKGAGAVALAAMLGSEANAMEEMTLYGLIGQMMAQPGRRAELIAILAEGTAGMPGCLAYVIAEDRGDENAIWITELWDSEESHAASLELPSVQAAIAQGRPLIAGFGHRFETTPVAGYPPAV
jgi:quinol monooxygenase YgiN